MASNVSVIIPSYNSAKFLPEAIESVLNQTYPVFEIVVVDDGSTDKTKEVCNCYPTVKYIYQENQGASVARNIGMQFSKGEYLLFLDSDDCLLPKAVETGLHYINARPEVGFVFGRYVFQLLNPDGSYTTEDIYGEQPEVASYGTLLASEHKIQCACVIFRRRAVESVGGFDPGLRTMEDINLFLRVAREFPIYFHHQIVSQYRYNGSNISRKPARMLISAMNSHRLQWDYIQQTGNKEYAAAYERGKKAWIKLFIERLPYEIMRYLEAGQWISALGTFRLMLHYDPKLTYIERAIYESCYEAILSQLRTLPIESSLAYWKQQLAGAPPLLPLPTDRPRGAESTFWGSSQSFVLSQELTAGLSLLSQQTGVTLFMTLLAAFDTLLYRYTGTEDILVGSPIAKRDRGEIFVNAVALRTDMSGNPSFQQLLERVREVTTSAHNHHHLPYCLLVNELQPERELSYSTLFQVMFALEEDVSLQKLDAANLTASPWVLENNEGRFELTLFLKPSNNGLIGNWVYNTDLFDAETIQRLNGHFQTLLESIIDNPEQPISQLPLLTTDERQQLLVEWNNTQTEYPQDKCIHQLFENQVERTPDAVAVVFENQQITYRELNHRANQLAHYLQKLGVKPDVLVGICLERSLEMIVGLLGILKAGGAYVPLDPAYPTERLTYMLSDSQMPVLVTEQNLGSLLPENQAKVVCLDTDWQDISQENNENPFSNVTVEKLAYVIYTSGSTGKPKGVQIPHGSVTNFLTTMAIKPGLTDKDILLAITTISFDIAVLELYLPLILGARVVLVSREVAVDGIKLLELLKESKATVMQATPATWQLLLAAGWNERSQLKVLCGGEALSPELASQLLARASSVWNMYGPTEATVWATTYEVNSQQSLVETQKSAISIGKPIGNIQTYILDRYLQPVPIGVRGELYIGGVCLARGYLNRPDLTSEKFIANPFSNDPSSRLYKTGDLARYLPNGDIEYINRIDNQVKIRGFRIELGEIEVLLAKHPDIVQLAVIVREDVPGDKRLVAYIVPHQERIPTVNDLRDFLSQKLPQYMIPSAFVTLDSLPLTPNGKVDRKALLAVNMFSTNEKADQQTLPTPTIERLQLKTVYIKPQNETEKILTSIWQEVLKIDSIGIDDNFFELGGHSLLIAQLRNKISQVLGLQISIVEVFQYPTIQTLAKYLVDRDRSQKQNSKYKSNSKIIEQTASAELTKDIAIIGMAGRFPGATNIDEFWQNLRDGVESISQLSDQELRLAGIESNLLNDPNYVKVAAVIPNIEEFDASFFGYTPKEAQVIDPQQRLFLECAWSALENAGYQPDSDNYTIGVYGGTAPSTYLLNNICHNSDLAAGRLIESASWLQAFIGNSGDFLTTRIAYKLNLTGPAINVQTACSTSLVAVHMACQSLLRGECDIALAGGVSLQQKAGYFYQEGMIFSPDGHSHPFDASAQGIVPGDGAGVVVLKPLKQAIADGDYIYAKIKGSALNNDGNLKVGYTAPGVDGQAAVIAAAQKDASVDPETITYVETHGTGTPLGDPIEIAGLTQAFRTKTDKKGYCAIGSVKSNIGHLNTAAGVASLIKTALVLKHKQIPPSLNFERPNPEIDFANSPFYVNTKLSAWESNGSPRRAGVSAFGFGGTNAHVVLEEWDNTTRKSKVIDAQAASRTPKARVSQKSKELLVLSAKTASALDTATINLATYLKQHPEINLADVAYTLSVGRVGFNHRRIVVVSDVEDAANTLNTVDKKRVLTNSGTIKPRSVVFMFSGQGSQYVNMARELYETEAYFQEQIDLCCEILQPHLGFDLREVLYPSADEIETATAKLTQTSTTQPALFVIEYAIAQLWISWGIIPVATIGHSIGEYVAATLAGVFTLEDALALVAARGQLMDLMPSGAMLAVPLPEEEVRVLLEGTSLQIAVINSPSNCVVSGTTAAIEAFEQQLAAREIEGRRLHTSHAFHSEMMEPILEPFTDKVKQIRLNAPTIPFVSNVTGTWITVEAATNPSYYARHLRQTVRFADGVKQFFDSPDQILLEVGPGRTLSTLAKRHPDKPSEQITLTSVRHPQDEYSDISFILNNLGQMWLAGLEVNWSVFYGEQPHYRVPLPTYPFERKRYWIEPSLQTKNDTINEGKKPDIADWFYVPIWKQSLNIPTAKLTSSILVFVDECGLGDRLVAELKSQGLEVVTVRIGENFDRVDNHSYSFNPSQPQNYKALIQELVTQKLIPKTILHLWSITANSEAALTIESLDKQQNLGFYSLLYLTQALGQKNVTEEMKLLVISNHLQNVNGEEQLCPAKATLLGPVRVISQEYTHIRCASVDVVLPTADSKHEQKLIAQLLREIQQKSPDKIIAYRGHHRWLQTFEPMRLEPLTSEASILKAEGVYLITGGLGGIGLVLANHLAKTLRAKLILTGRTTLPEREQWQQWLADRSEEDSISEKIRKVQELEALGAEVLVVNADVANLQQMETAIAKAYHRFGQINGVIHAAGVPGGDVIHLKTQEMAESVLAPKVQGTVVLESIFKNSQLDFMILCSSIASIIGNFGRVDYTAANAFLDAYAHYQNTHNRLTISINWDAWREVGMAAKALDSSQNKAGIINLDFAILPHEGIDVFNRIGNSQLPQVAVSTRELQTTLQQFSVVDTEEPSASLARNNFAQLSSQLEQSQGYPTSKNHLEQTITQVWQQVLGIDNIGLHDNFFELGGDSLVAVQLLTKLRKAFESKISSSLESSSINLPLNLLFEAPTIESLVKYCEVFQFATPELPLHKHTIDSEDREEIEL
jgi:amino acid adenylation domain-containing protein